MRLACPRVPGPGRNDPLVAAFPFRPLQAVAGAAVLTLNLLASDWPQWRGPNRDGISAETGWSSAWPKEGLKQVWKAEVGAGYGSVAVSRGRLYVMGNTADQDTVYCLDANSGAAIWTHTYACPAKDPNWFHGPRCTPSVDDDRVYTISRQGQLFCLATANGAVKWSADLVKDFKAEVPFYGYSLSPLIEGDRVMVEVGGPGASVVAFDKRSGAVVWQAGDDPASFSSPVAFDLQGERCVVVFTANGPVGRRAKDGVELWRFPWKTNPEIHAATPLVQGDKVFISSGYGAGCALIDVGTAPPTLVWKSKGMRNHFSTCVLWQGHLYGFDENTLKCIEFATGDVKWVEKKYGKGSLMLADGKLLLYSQRGQLGLAAATPDGYGELAFIQALEVRPEYPGKAEKQTWAVPVLANGRIYCRSQDDLVCLDARGF